MSTLDPGQNSTTVADYPHDISADDFPLAQGWHHTRADVDFRHIPFASDSNRASADPSTIEVDAHGCPVTLPAADWLVCFVPGLRKQWWHGLAHRRHKHVFAMRKINAHTWIIVEPWWTRLMVNVLSGDQARHFLRWAATGNVVKVREAIPGHGSQLRGWSNCAVLIAFLLGRSYRTWSPHGLFKRLIAEEGAEAMDASRLLLEHFQTADPQAGHAPQRPCRLESREPTAALAMNA